MKEGGYEDKEKIAEYLTNQEKFYKGVDSKSFSCRFEASLR